MRSSPSLTRPRSSPVSAVPDRPARRPAARRKARRWLTIGGTSVVLHGLIVWGLLVGVPRMPDLVEPQSVQVELVRPDKPAQPRPAPSTITQAAPPAAAHRASTPIGAPSLPIPPAPPAKPAGPAEIVAPPGFTARGTLTGGGDALRQAARKSACTEADIVKLTKAERDACAEALGEKHKNGPALYAAIDPEKKAAFDGDCKKDDEWCLYRTGKGPYPGLFAIGKKKKIKGWDD